MKKIIPLIFFINITILSMHSQSLELNMRSFFGVWHNESPEFYYGGTGLEITYDHSLKKGGLRGGLEYRHIKCGNQTFLKTG